MNLRRRARVVSLVLVLATLVACTSDSGKPAALASSSSAPSPTPVTFPPHATGPSAGCHATPVVAPGSSDQTIMSGGQQRVYELDVPDSYDGTKPYAIVFGLHALSISYKFIPSVTGISEMLKRFDFIGVAPSGLVDGSTPYWNAAPVADNYDVDFFNALLDHLEATLCIDQSRVFSMGQSNGAQMSELLACRLPERITAIGPVAGVEFPPPCNGAPVPIIAFHGTADPILPYAGGGLNATKIADDQFYKGHLPPGLPPPLGVDDSIQLWAVHNGCDPTPIETQVSPEVKLRTWANCKAATKLYIIIGGGHTWPGKPFPAFEAQFGHTTTDIDATDLIFSFFFDGQN